MSDPNACNRGTHNTVPFDGCPQDNSYDSVLRWVVVVGFCPRPNTSAGTAYYVRKSSHGGGGDGKRPGGYPISFMAGPAKVPEATPDSATPPAAADKGGAAKEGDAAPTAPV